MKGHKRLRGKSYELRVYAGIDSATGKKLVVTRSFKGSAKDADGALRDLITEVERGEHGGSSSTVGKLLNDWLDHVESLGRSPTTMREYRRLVKRTIPESVKRLQCRKLGVRDLDKMYASLSGSRQQAHAIMRAALEQGMKWGYVSRNVAKLASVKAPEPHARHAPAVDAVTKMITEAQTGSQPDQQLAVLVALAAVTGARRGELCALRWGDIDYKARTVTISRSIAVMGRNELVTKGTKTHATRVLALDPSAARLLKAHESYCVALARSKHRDPPAPDGPILSYDGTNPMNPDYASHQVRDLATRCGVDTHLHALRHQAATQMVGAGVNIRTVAGRLGHANTSTTLNIYSHALPEKDKEAAVHLGKVLPKVPRKPRSQLRSPVTK